MHIEAKGISKTFYSIYFDAKIRSRKVLSIAIMGRRVSAEIKVPNPTP